MFGDATTIGSLNPLLAWSAIACAASAAAILIWFLFRRPQLTAQTRALLLLGFGVFPIGAALITNVADFEHTKTRAFCGSCHVMTPFTDDAGDPESTTLAAIHGRNEHFGGENCYTCHQDYGMYGTVATKIGGMRHVWLYYTEFHDMTFEEARPHLRIRVPFPNANCMSCHTTTTPLWNEVPEHASLGDATRDGSVSCVSAGCHGRPHPFPRASESTHGAAP
jgi:nitrate/TMAO reductase-like tetraheme cytochrome c subunit